MCMGVYYFEFDGFGEMVWGPGWVGGLGAGGWEWEWERFLALVDFIKF